VAAVTGGKERTKLRGGRGVPAHYLVRT